MCPICAWEDDLSQLRFVRYAGGANKPSLIEAQKNFVSLGASEPRLISLVRPPHSSEIRDPEWRLVDEKTDVPEEPVIGVEYGGTYPTDETTLYYWRPNFWLRNSQHR